MSPTFTSSLSAPAEVQRILDAATSYETPCGTGSIVWHVWSAPFQAPGRTPVVLFHGGSGSWTHWLRNIESLVASGRTVYVPDLPGFGESASPPVGGDADAEPQPLEDGLQLLLGAQACDLVGFSFGGMVAGFLAERFPARAHRVVLAGAPALGILPDTPVPLRAWRHIEGEALREPIHRHNLSALMLYRPEAITDLAMYIHVSNVLRDRMQSRRLSRTDALARALMLVQCPVHAIYGSEDVLYRGRHNQLNAALEALPKFRGLRWIEDAGHWVQFERAEAFDAALLAVLDSSV